MSEAEHHITVLTQDDCQLCDHAKGVLGRVAADHPLRIEEISLNSDQGRALAARAGVLFAPGVFVDGALFGFGRLSERKLRRALNQVARG